MFWRTTRSFVLFRVSWKSEFNKNLCLAKIVDHAKFFDVRKQKEVMGLKSGLCGGWPINSTFWSVKKALISAVVWEHALSCWTMIRLLLFVFSNFTEDKLRGSTQKWSSYVAEVEQLLHDQFCRRNGRPFASKCFFHKQLPLDLACLQRPTWWTVVLLRAHTQRSMICHLWQSLKRLLKHSHCIFPYVVVYVIQDFGIYLCRPTSPLTDFRIVQSRQFLMLY